MAFFSTTSFLNRARSALLLLRVTDFILDVGCCRVTTLTCYVPKIQLILSQAQPLCSVHTSASTGSLAQTSSNVHAKEHIRNEAYMNTAGDGVPENQQCFTRDWGVAALLMDD